MSASLVQITEIKLFPTQYKNGIHPAFSQIVKFNALSICTTGRSNMLPWNISQVSSAHYDGDQSIYEYPLFTILQKVS